MIQANELRRGNYVIADEGDIVEVKEIMERNMRYKYITGESHWKSHYDDISPIELTEDWLVRMGFEDWSGDQIYAKFGIKINEINNIVFAWHIKSKCIEWSSVDDVSITHIKYVHQLQNLYFALTNTELTIK